MSLLALMFAVASVTWMIPLARSGRLIWSSMIILATGTVFGPQFFSVDGPIQISVDRLLFFVTFALAFAGLRFGITELPRLHRMDWLMVAILVWFGLSAATGGGDPPGTPPVARWLFYVALPTGMYVIARLVKIRVDDVRWMLGGATALGVYLAITAVFEIKGIHGLVFPRYIVDADAWEFYGRGRGPLMNPSGNGIVIAIGLVSAAISFVYSSRKRRLLAGLLVFCLLVGIYATLTRSAWLGGIAALGVVGFMYSPRWMRVYCLIIVLLLGAGAAMGLKESLVRLKRDKNLSAADAEKSVKLRPLLAIIAWEMFKDKPITGHGYGHYFAKHQPYHQDRSYAMPLEQARPYAQHNVFLSVLVDTGILGFGLFAGWFVSIAGIGWKLARDAPGREVRSVGLLMLGTLLAYFCNGMFQDVMIIPMVHMYLFFLTGVAMTVTQSGVAAAPAERLPVYRRASGVAPNAS